MSSCGGRKPPDCPTSGAKASLAMPPKRSRNSFARPRNPARGTRSRDLVVVGYMGHFDVHLARLLWPRTPLALDHLVSARDTALDRRVSSRWLVRVLDWLDRAAVHAAHFPCVDTAEHRERVCAAARGRAVV